MFPVTVEVHVLRLVIGLGIAIGENGESTDLVPLLQLNPVEVAVDAHCARRIDPGMPAK
jgi:hypothetical protein